MFTNPSENKTYRLTIISEFIILYLNLFHPLIMIV
jgi:hypothetical protein